MQTQNPVTWQNHIKMGAHIKKQSERENWTVMCPQDHSSTLSAYMSSDRYIDRYIYILKSRFLVKQYKRLKIPAWTAHFKEIKDSILSNDHCDESLAARIRVNATGLC